MRNEECKRVCQKCGKDLTNTSGEYCDNCGELVPNRYEKIKKKNILLEKNKSYNLLLSSSGNILPVFIIIALMSFLIAVGSFLDFKIGNSIIFAMSGVVSIMLGYLIDRLCKCIAEITKNTEKQTELLEKLNEKLDK